MGELQMPTDLESPTQVESRLQGPQQFATTTSSTMSRVWEPGESRSFRVLRSFREILSATTTRPGVVTGELAAAESTLVGKVLRSWTIRFPITRAETPRPVVVAL